MMKYMRHLSEREASEMRALFDIVELCQEELEENVSERRRKHLRALIDLSRSKLREL